MIDAISEDAPRVLGVPTKDCEEPALDGAHEKERKCLNRVVSCVRFIFMMVLIMPRMSCEDEEDEDEEDEDEEDEDEEDEDEEDEYNDVVDVELVTVGACCENEDADEDTLTSSPFSSSSAVSTSNTSFGLIG